MIILLFFGSLLMGCHRRAQVVYAVPAASVAVAPPVASADPQVVVTPSQPAGQWGWNGHKYVWRVAAQAPIRPVVQHFAMPSGPQHYVVDRRATRRAQRAYKRALKRHRRDVKRHRKQMRRYHRELRRQGYRVQGPVYVY